jgi:peptidoglycan-N-acetylglucosamine deacetylase
VPAIALTFDDGPDPRWTPRIVEMLDAHDVRATFFVVGERAARAPNVVRAIAQGGHELANHSWSHSSLWTCGPGRTAIEIARTHALLTSLSDRAPRLFRPPWGMMNAAMFAALRRHRLRCVLWSIQPEGLRPADARAQVRHVLRRARAGAIVDLHDAEGTPGAPQRLYAALPEMIDGLRRGGYQLTTVSDLLDRSPGGRASTRDSCPGSLPL